jgi:acyl-CoA reductase-like NAD-dependent aldehyde dehydrogenase
VDHIVLSVVSYADELYFLVKIHVKIWFLNFQTCVSANRFLIQDEIFDVFVEKICKKIKTLTVGYGMDHSCSLGPLINTAQAHKVRHYTYFLTG